jgi:L-asparaginase
MDNSEKKFEILLILAGGTIAQEHDESGTTYDNSDNGFASKIRKIACEIKELLNDKPSKGETRKIDHIEVDCSLKNLQKDGTFVCSKDWVALISKIEEKYDDYDAFVITHGTNTMGYTSAALSFAFENLTKPVILTGSQVSLGYPGSDVRMNLENAIRIAAYKETIPGVLVVFGSAIITGTRAKKKTEFDYDAFKAFNANTIGSIGNHIRINKSVLEEHEQSWKGKSLELKVTKEFNMQIASLTEFPGMNSELLIALVSNENYPVKGIILRATGAGDPNVADDSNNLRVGFKHLKSKKIPIVVTTQAPDGIASMDINSPGKMAKDLNAIPAMDMSIEAMTVKLSWLLGQKLKTEQDGVCTTNQELTNEDYEEIRRLMAEPIRGEIRKEE